MINDDCHRLSPLIVSYHDLCDCNLISYVNVNVDKTKEKANKDLLKEFNK